MRMTLLILLTALMPLAWGWWVHWSFSRLWPFAAEAVESSEQADRPAPPIDYEI